MYHSPFHLIDPAVFEAGDDAVALKRRLGLEKRKLLAEFELAGTPTITLHGRELQRQDVSELFDEFQDSARLGLHLSIWTHKAFLQFLESGQPGGEGDWLYPQASEADDNLLLRFVSPFYAEALNRYLQRCLLNQDDPRSLLYELRADDWLLPTDNDNAYRYVTRFFTEKKNELLNIRYRSEQRQPVDESELRSWCNDQQIHVLNRLPDQFDDLRYRLAERLNNLCVLYDRQQVKKHALAAIERASTIRVNDEELERLVPANLRIIRNKNGATLMQVDPDTGKRRVRILPVILLLVFLARIIGAGIGCFRASAPDSGSTIHYEQEAPEHTPQEASFGALIAALAGPTSAVPPDGDVIRLERPGKTGDDPFAPLFPAMTSGASTIRERVAGFGYDSSTLLLRNQSPVEAIFLLRIGAGTMRSVWIPPGEQFALRYPPVPLALQLYAGRDWDDSLRNSYLIHTGASSTRQQAFRGGFRTRVALAGEQDEAVDVPMFARHPPEHGTQDTISVSGGPNRVAVFYNLGSD